MTEPAYEMTSSHGNLRGDAKTSLNRDLRNLEAKYARSVRSTRKSGETYLAVISLVDQ